MEPNRTEQIIFSKFSALDSLDEVSIREKHHRILVISSDEKFLKQSESFAMFDQKQAVQGFL